MSCSTERRVALEYGKCGYLFELQTGMVTRGANLQWLSYYPEESEVCLPPCTAVEVIRKDRMEQGAVVLQLGIVSLFATTTNNNQQQANQNTNSKK